MDVGDTIAGKYRLDQLIGKGGMGAVYAATNVVIGKKVAVKVLHASFAEHREALQRFLQEARTAASVDHPGIVEIFDFGWATHDGLEFPYLVMELLRGQSLSTVLRDAGRAAEFGFAVETTLDVLSILAAVHEQGIIHRDLKPENVFLAQQRDGSRRAKILDFGISKVNTDQGGGLTVTGTVLGTPYFMSPEQAAGSKTMDHRVDLWAMGAILYLMLTDRVPFPGDSYNEILAKIVREDFTPPRKYRADLPEWLEAVVLRAMAWHPDDRYLSADEFALDLRMKWEQAGEPRTAKVMPGPSATASLQDEIPTVAPGVVEPGDTHAAMTPWPVSAAERASSEKSVPSRPAWAVTPPTIVTGGAVADSLTAAVNKFPP